MDSRQNIVEYYNFIYLQVKYIRNVPDFNTDEFFNRCAEYLNQNHICDSFGEFLTKMEIWSYFSAHLLLLSHCIWFSNLSEIASPVLQWCRKVSF